MPLKDRQPAAAVPLLLWLAIALVLIGGAWGTWNVDRLGKEVGRLRVQIGGLPQVVEREIDCGCVRCECCQCRGNAERGIRSAE